jgi:hypothetical protein
MIPVWTISLSDDELVKGFGFSRERSADPSPIAAKDYVPVHLQFFEKKRTTSESFLPQPFFRPIFVMKAELRLPLSRPHRREFVRFRISYSTIWPK